MVMTTKEALTYARSGSLSLEGRSINRDREALMVLSELIEKYESAAIQILTLRPGCRCDKEDCGAGDCSQCKLMLATEYLDETILS